MKEGCVGRKLGPVLLLFRKAEHTDGGGWGRLQRRALEEDTGPD